MHPYEMKSKMKERGHDQVVKIRGGSIYDTVARLEEGGFIRAQETSREGRRPEKTVYSITDTGREEILDWLRELLAQPVNDYPQFGAALAFFAILPKEEVIRLLKLRTALLEGQVAGSQIQLKTFLEMGLPRLFLIEGEYAQTMKQAELDWIRRLIHDIEAGDLWLTKDHMQDVSDRFEGKWQGGEG